MKFMLSLATVLVLIVLSVFFYGQGFSLYDALRSVGLPPGALPIIGLCLIAIANTRKQAQTEL